MTVVAPETYCEIKAPCSPTQSEISIFPTIRKIFQREAKMCQQKTNNFRLS
jgi:hypothetical protein